MTLPFDNGRENKQVWQCFCCGLETKEGYLQFKEHILAAHEEGRDYVLCPKCDAPVRDLNMHYRARHPGWALPSGVQLKATVWMDQYSKKKKPAVKFREGTFISTKNGGKELHYRSGYEAEVYELLEMLPDVVSFHGEHLKIPYLHDGKWRTYIPDLSILFADGRKEIWEIKPATQTSLPVNQSKWTAAQEYCDKMGWGFMVLTEVGMGKLRRQVQNLRD